MSRLATGTEKPGSTDTLDHPWARTLPARLLRDAILCGLLDPIIRHYARIRVEGRDRVEQLKGPAIFAASHASHIDTPILQRALPATRRRRTAFAAASDYFYRRHLKSALVSLVFGTVPIERRAGAGGGGSAIEGLRRFVRDGWSLAVYPEGTRSRDGRVGVLRPGAAVLAAELELPLVPVYLGGTREVMPAGSRWPGRRPDGGRHEVRVSFGPPIDTLAVGDRFEVMEEVRLFMAGCGAETTPDPKRLRRVAARPSLADRPGASA